MFKICFTKFCAVLILIISPSLFIQFHSIVNFLFGDLEQQAKLSLEQSWLITCGLAKKKKKLISQFQLINTRDSNQAVQAPLKAHSIALKHPKIIGYSHKNGPSVIYELLYS